MPRVARGFIAVGNATWRLAESGFAGEIFNVTDRSRATVGEMAEAAARAAGHEGSVRMLPVEEEPDPGPAVDRADLRQLVAHARHIQLA